MVWTGLDNTECLLCCPTRRIGNKGGGMACHGTARQASQGKAPEYGMYNGPHGSWSDLRRKSF
jgi:hypothetical protein